MLIVAVIVLVVIGLVVLMRWADKRDRANGHVNRGMGDIRSNIRATRTNAKLLRQPGGRQAAKTPHEFARRDDRRPRP
jgi:hypothetical protein